MGGRGTFAAGKIVKYAYFTIGTIEGVKVLAGLNGRHKLPEEAHSSYAYIRLEPDGTFHEMRIYDKDHFLRFEIAYHPEPSLILAAGKSCIGTYMTETSKDPKLCLCQGL